MVQLVKDANNSWVVQGVLAIMLWGAIVFLACTTKDIPDALTTGGAVILGYFFRTVNGTKSGG